VHPTVAGDGRFSPRTPASDMHMTVVTGHPSGNREEGLDGADSIKNRLASSAFCHPIRSLGHATRQRHEAPTEHAVRHRRGGFASLALSPAVAYRRWQVMVHVAQS
jgi:hypothetical protein